MKIFDKNYGYTDKVNFVDKNNVVVGYDTTQNCCEDAGWFFADRLETFLSREERDELNSSCLHDKINIDEFVFDATFYEEADTEDSDLGGMAVFKLTNGTQAIYLYLFNCHNGYYSHGFEFKNGENILQEGYL